MIECVPSITAVVLNWHSSADTIACVESLEASSLKIRIVIVDNNSQDGSEQILKRRFLEHSVIQTGANLGFGGGCNVGILAALDSGADFVFLLNSDALIEPTTILALVSRALGSPKIGITGAPIRNLPDNGKFQEWGGGTVNPLVGSVSVASQEMEEDALDYICGACMLLNANMLRKVGLFDQERFFLYWEDVDLAWRAVKSGWTLAVAKDALVFHRGNSSIGRGSALQRIHFNASAVRFFRKHSRYPFIPIAIGAALRIGKAAVQADPMRAWNAIRGIREGLGKASVRG